MAIGAAELDGDGLDPVDAPGPGRAGEVEGRGAAQPGRPLRERTSIDGDDRIAATDLLHGRFLLLRRGKAHHALAIVTSG